MEEEKAADDDQIMEAAAPSEDSEVGSEEADKEPAWQSEGEDRPADHQNIDQQMAESQQQIIHDEEDEAAASDEEGSMPINIPKAISALGPLRALKMRKWRNVYINRMTKI